MADFVQLGHARLIYVKWRKYGLCSVFPIFRHIYYSASNVYTAPFLVLMSYRYVFSASGIFSIASG